MLYKENLGKATPTPITPEMERVKRNQENFSSVFQRGKNKLLHFLTSLANMVIPLIYLTVFPKLLSLKISLNPLKNNKPTPPAQTDLILSSSFALNHNILMALAS